MEIKVFDSNQILKEEYDAPSGFQLERYASSLHPGSSASIRLLDYDKDYDLLCVDVYEGDDFIERHLGKYESKILQHLKYFSLSSK